MTTNIVLFGKTGCGKSTVANALVTGGIEPPIVFPSSDAPTGCTSEISKKSGRGWAVTDTIGLGEGKLGTKSNTEAKNELTVFLKKVKDAYSHIIFVQKADRVTELDEMIWLLFTSIFEGAEDAFVVLFTAADEMWLKDNESKLPTDMARYAKFAVDIPPYVSDSDQQVREKRNKEKRERSLQELEKNLVAHFALRGNKDSVPKIVGMTDEELEKKSSRLLDLVIDLIRNLFDPVQWEKAANAISSILNVVERFKNA
ncbi:unnamed protein product [Calypogeia fissa]